MANLLERHSTRSTHFQPVRSGLKPRNRNVKVKSYTSLAHLEQRLCFITDLLSMKIWESRVNSL